MTGFALNVCTFGYIHKMQINEAFYVLCAIYRSIMRRISLRLLIYIISLIFYRADKSKSSLELNGTWSVLNRFIWFLPNTNRNMKVKLRLQGTTMFSYRSFGPTLLDPTSKTSKLSPNQTPSPIFMKFYMVSQHCRVHQW